MSLNDNMTLESLHYLHITLRTCNCPQNCVTVGIHSPDTSCSSQAALPSETTHPPREVVNPAGDDRLLRNFTIPCERASSRISSWRPFGAALGCRIYSPSLSFESAQQPSESLRTGRLPAAGIIISLVLYLAQVAQMWACVWQRGTSLAGQFCNLLRVASQQNPR